VFTTRIGLYKTNIYIEATLALCKRRFAGLLPPSLIMGSDSHSIKNEVASTVKNHRKKSGSTLNQQNASANVYNTVIGIKCFLVPLSHSTFEGEMIADRFFNMTLCCLLNVNKGMQIKKANNTGYQYQLLVIRHEIENGKVNAAYSANICR